MKKIIVFIMLFSAFAQGINKEFLLPREIWNIIFDYLYKNKNYKNIYLVNKNFNDFFSSITLNLTVADKNINSIERLKNTLNKGLRIKIFYSSYDSFKDLLIRLKNITSLNLPKCSISDEALKCITLLTNLKSLLYDLDPFSGGNRSLEDLNLPGPKDLNLVHVGKIINIKTLYLGGGIQRIGDEGISYLSHLTNIEDLRLSNNWISNDGLKYLSIFINIRKLNLYGSTKITDEGLKHLSLLINLKELSLLYCKAISGEGFRDLNSLTSISLNKNESIENCSNLTNLKKLAIKSSDEFSNEELKCLSNFNNLEHLKLWGCNNITDDGLKYMGRNLKKLNLTYCDQISEEGINKQLSNLQGLKIEFRKFISQRYICFVMPDKKREVK